MACEAARNLASKALVKGNIAYNAGNYTDAVRHYTEAINHAPSEIGHQNRSWGYFQLEQYSNALKDAKKTVELKPDWYAGYRCLGNAHSALKQYDEAAAAYKKGLEVDPNNVALTSALANVQVYIKAKAELNAARQRPLMTEEKADQFFTDHDDMDDDQEDEVNDHDLILLFKQLITQQNIVQQRILELFDHNKVIQVDDDDRFSIKAAFSVLNRMVDDGLIEEAGELWFVATDLFEDAPKRELFISLPHDKGRLAWLQHKQKKQDPLILNKSNNVGGAEEKKEEPKKLEMSDDDMGYILLNMIN